MAYQGGGSKGLKERVRTGRRGTAVGWDHSISVGHVGMYMAIGGYLSVIRGKAGGQVKERGKARWTKRPNRREQGEAQRRKMGRLMLGKEIDQET